MKAEEFIRELENCIRDEFVAVTEIKENTIYIRFLNGQLLSIVIQNIT